MDYLLAPERHAARGFVLRSYRTGDGAALAAALEGSYDHLRTFLPWAEPRTSERAAERRVRHFRAQWLLARDFVVAVANEADTEILGGTGFHLRGAKLEVRTAEIGMWLRPDAAHAGLGTRVLVAMLEWGFSAWPWERLSWHCSTRNLASIRVAEKAGMTREGVLRGDRIETDGERGDTMLFGALRGHWARPEPR